MHGSIGLHYDLDPFILIISEVRVALRRLSSSGVLLIAIAVSTCNRRFYMNGACYFAVVQASDFSSHGVRQPGARQHQPTRNERMAGHGGVQAAFLLQLFLAVGAVDYLLRQLCFGHASCASSIESESRTGFSLLANFVNRCARAMAMPVASVQAIAISGHDCGKREFCTPAQCSRVDPKYIDRVLLANDCQISRRWGSLRWNNIDNEKKRNV